MDRPNRRGSSVVGGGKLSTLGEGSFPCALPLRWTDPVIMVRQLQPSPWLMHHCIYFVYVARGVTIRGTRYVSVIC